MIKSRRYQRAGVRADVAGNAASAAPLRRRPARFPGSARHLAA